MSGLQKEPGFYSQPKSWATMFVSIAAVVVFLKLLEPTRRNRERGW